MDVARESTILPKGENYVISEEEWEIKAHSNTEFCPLIYEIIPAHGCEFGCEYCNVYSLQDEKKFLPVKVFAHYPELLRNAIDEHRALAGGRKVVYYFSPKTDVFQGPLIETGLTQKILEVFKEKQADYILVTKGSLPNEDIFNLLHQTRSKGRVLVSVGMKNESHARILEPHAATIEERFALAERCTTAGIPAMGIVEPILPLNDLTFIRDIMKRFVALGIDHFAIDFARISRLCLENMISKLPELEELRAVYYAPEAIVQEFETGPYHREKVARYAPSHKYLTDNFNLLRTWAQELGGTVSICNFFKVPGINTDAYKRGFLCFGIHDSERANEFLQLDIRNNAAGTCSQA